MFPKLTSAIHSPRALLRTALTPLVIIASLALSTHFASAQILKLRLPFDETPGSTTTASDTSGGGVGITLNLVNGANAATDLHGPSGSGVEGSGGALNLSSGSAAGNTAGPLASAVNQAALGFGQVTNFTATIWFKQTAIFNNTLNQGPRLWCLGANGITDTGNANSVSVQYYGFAPGNAHRQVAVRLGADNPTLGTPFPTTPFLPTNIWEYLACVYDGTNLMIYSGTETSPAKLVAIQTSTNRVFDFGASGSVLIGNRLDRVRSYAGWVDDFRFYLGAGDASFVENIRRSSTPMVFTDTFPDGLRLLEGTNTLTFNIASVAGVDTNSLKVAVNGADVSSSLVLSGTTNNLTVLYTGLPVNTAPTAAVALNGVTYSIRVTDAAGLVASNIVTYDSFAANNFTWEAEEWNFTNGMYLDNAVYSSVPLPSSYYGLSGTVNIDFHDQDGSGAHFYRTNDTMCTAVPAGTPGDLFNPRSAAAVANDPSIRVVNIENFYGGVDATDSEWVNYTRTFPGGLYHVYARISSGAASAATLSAVTNGWGTTSQETSQLGTFTLNTGSYRLFNYVPLLDTNGTLARLTLNDTNTLRFRRVFGTASDVNADFFVLVPVNTNLPAITNLYPDGTVQFQTTNRLSFTASSATGAISTNGIRVSLSVTNVGTHYTTNLTCTNGLVLTGSTASWNVSYAGLITNAAYVAVITVSDAVNNTVTTTRIFDTYSPSFTWEAEDFDHSGGYFFDNPQTNAFVSAWGYADIDFHNLANANETFVYRPNGGGVGNQVNGDVPRSDYSETGFTDYNLGWFDSPEWVNYTRIFPAGNYNVYIRGANGGTAANVGAAILSQVTDGWGTASQTVTNLGTAAILSTGGWQTYNWHPFRDANGNLVKLTTGNTTNTLRLTSGGYLNPNYFMLLPANTNLPTLTQLYPDGTALFQTTNKLTFTASSPAGINTNSISVTLNGVTVTNLVISGSSMAWNVSYSHLQPNTTYTATVTVTDANGNAAIRTIAFDTFNPTYYTWEAEDYDYGNGSTGGLFIDNRQTNAYFGLSGMLDVDYHELFINLPQVRYRTADAMGTEVSGDLLRPQYAGTNDFHLGWFTAGEWVNYTRTFPTGTYHIYGRFARGTTGLATPALSQVTSGWGTVDQTTNTLGIFSVDQTAGWETYAWTPLRDAANNFVALSLGGTNTLRLTSAGPVANTEANANFFMLVPVASSVTLSAARNGGNLVLSFPTETGFNYQVQYKQNIGDLGWSNLGSAIPGDGTIKSISDPVTGSTRFYRLEIQ